MLNHYASDFGISFAQLHEACSSGVAIKHKVYMHSHLGINHSQFLIDLLMQDAFRYLMAVDDFILFKFIMVKRNIQLNNEAETASTTKQSNFPEKTKLENSFAAENSIEDTILEEVLKRSIMEQKQEIEDKSFEKLLHLTLQESLKTERETKPETQTDSKLKENSALQNQQSTPLNKHVKTQERSAELHVNEPTFSVIKTREECSASTEPTKGGGKSLLRQGTGSEAAANQWIVSAREEAGTTTTLPTSSEQQQKVGLVIITNCSAVGNTIPVVSCPNQYTKVSFLHVLTIDVVFLSFRSVDQHLIICIVDACYRFYVNCNKKTPQKKERFT